MMNAVPFHISADELIVLLTKLFHEGRGFSCVNVVQIAFATLSLQDSKSVGVHPSVRILLRGVFYVGQWEGELQATVKCVLRADWKEWIESLSLMLLGRAGHSTATGNGWYIWRLTDHIVWSWKQQEMTHLWIGENEMSVGGIACFICILCSFECHINRLWCSSAYAKIKGLISWPATDENQARKALLCLLELSLLAWFFNSWKQQSVMTHKQRHCFTDFTFSKLFYWIHFCMTVFFFSTWSA